MSRTEVHGIPVMREEELVFNEPSLLEVWRTINGQTGQQVQIMASYIWETHRVERVIFSTAILPPQPQTQPQAQPQPDFREFLPERPDISRPPRIFSPGNPFSGPTPFAFLQGLTRILRTYWEAIRTREQLDQYGGMSRGFADTIARISASLTPDIERSGQRPEPPTIQIDRSAENWAILINTTRREGYLAGSRDAIRYYRGLSNEDAISLLRYLRRRYASGRDDVRNWVRDGIVREYMPDLNRYYRDEESGR
ncbi:MAG: hypothetical protein MUE44_17165 [Oscillatoriaceae cyanobacterium Prado104]|jgi:hypothetical protein|nr:hypothetical protein [Oscillatoriaceae cyanobacterium Prado104]